MNPTVAKEEIHFDSNFECGNLDLAICTGPSQYDLWLRVDSNTRGHACWFMFKVSSFSHHQKITFRIMNFTRRELMYKTGMKVYTLRSSNNQWRQTGKQASFTRTP